MRNMFLITSGTTFMSRLQLKFVNQFRDRHGKLRHYFRRGGCSSGAKTMHATSNRFSPLYAVKM